MIDDGSDKPLGHQTDDGELEVRNTGNGPEYHETELGQHQRWMRQASDLYEHYMAALETIAKLRAQQQDQITTLRAALEAFLEKWPAAEKAINGAIVIASVHGCNYTGPSLVKEFADLRAALAADRSPRDG